jgi:uncharacterized coiled-coil protein SlyX
MIHDFDDPDCLRSHNKATQVDSEKIEMEEKNLRLHLVLTRQGLLIDDLEEQVQDEKKIVQQVCNKKIQHESYLAFQDAVIEELEEEVDEMNKEGTAKQNQGPP